MQIQMKSKNVNSKHASVTKLVVVDRPVIIRVVEFK